MTEIQFLAMPSELAQSYRNGQPDAYGLLPERGISDGSGLPCRHCLCDIEAGASFLTLAYRPFPTPQPYAETGPVFLHEAPCARYPKTAQIPSMFLQRSQVMVKGYNRRHRIVYGTGSTIATTVLDQVAAALLQSPEVAYVHVRSASAGCFQCQIGPAGTAAPT